LIFGVEKEVVAAKPVALEEEAVAAVLSWTDNTFSTKKTIDVYSGDKLDLNFESSSAAAKYEVLFNDPGTPQAKLI